MVLPRFTPQRQILGALGMRVPTGNGRSGIDGS